MILTGLALIGIGLLADTAKNIYEANSMRGIYEAPASGKDDLYLPETEEEDDDDLDLPKEKL